MLWFPQQRIMEEVLSQLFLQSLAGSAGDRHGFSVPKVFHVVYTAAGNCHKSQYFNTTTK